MDFLIKLIELGNLSMSRPTNYGWFHLMFVGIVIVASVLMCVFFRNVSERGVRIICLVFWITIAVLEVYKQLNYTYTVVDGKIVADYLWYAFPFQLCSTPLYILPLVVFLPDGRLHDAMVAYMIAFSIFGGLCVYAFPNDVFTSTIGINIQTMIHHGIQIVSGVYLASRYRSKLNIKYYLKGAAVFVVMLGVAFLLNLTVPSALAAAGHTDEFNMFYIGPKYPCSLPILSTIYPKVPYPAFFAIYAFGFIAAAAIIFYAAKGIVILAHGLRMRLSKNAA
ncbi:MAG: YwaF family protein [Clostridia bacterium]|nr:YwaF family protein [Clostridia bacterium]